MVRCGRALSNRASRRAARGFATDSWRKAAGPPVVATERLDKSSMDQYTEVPEDARERIDLWTG